MTVRPASRDGGGEEDERRGAGERGAAERQACEDAGPFIPREPMADPLPHLEAVAFVAHRGVGCDEEPQGATDAGIRGGTCGTGVEMAADVGRPPRFAV